LDHRLQGLISIADTLRKGAKAAIDKIRQEGVSEIWMLTGDHPQVAQRIGEELGSAIRRSFFPKEVRSVKELREKAELWQWSVTV